MEYCKVFGKILNDDGSPDHGASILATVQSLDHPPSILKLSRVYANEQGYWEMNLPVLSSYEFTIRRKCIFNHLVEIPFSAILDTQSLFYS